MSSTLDFSVLLLLVVPVVFSSSADLHPEPITYILKSYADAFTSTTPTPSSPPAAAAPRPNDNVYAKSNQVRAYDDEPEEPPDHVIPYSEHENPPEPPTRPNYTGPGQWARPPADKNISLEFVPTKLYSQVRGSHSVKHVPRAEAIKNAETDEEKENAARLKEVVKITKANTVYSEEGYEDAAYDHAGQIRDADFHEGFAKKLNGHIDFSKKTGGKGKRRKHPRRKGRKRSRKGRSEDPVEGEARVSEQTVWPDEVTDAPLNSSIVGPKSVALEGIRELENDLRREAEESERKASTEPTPSISRTELYETTFPATELYDEPGSTTVKRDVFTVRPKKLTTPWPQVVRRTRKPASYNNIASDSYMPTSTESYEELLRQYVLKNPNLAPSVTSTSSRPLALATVNGHGPYLVVVTSPANLASSSFEPLTSETTSRYYTIVPRNRTNYKVFESKNRKLKIAGDSESHSYNDNADNEEEHEEELRNFEFTKKPDDNNVKDDDEEQPQEQEEDEEFTLMQPPKEPDYPPVENEAYSVVEEDVETPPPPAPLRQESLLLPVTRLLPPSPLSTSEYTSFQMHDRKGEIGLPPTVMAIIEAIHRKEQKPASVFPFLFRRRKRSTRGPSREWEILQRDKKLRAAARADTVETTTPKDFKHLLDESPAVAQEEVDKEIGERFKDDSEATESPSSEVYLEKNKTREDEHVEVEVSFPELDFSSSFDDDEDDRSTVPKPGINSDKYPFYKNDAVLSTALEYVVNPTLVPRKTFGGMEFYDSRRRECEDIEPNLDKLVPENEELESKRGSRKSKQRLHGLGTKLDCFKAKYFDEDPLDNPLFREELVELPPLPDELDPKKFASRISKLPRDKDEYVVHRGPKSPDRLESRTEKMVRTRPYVTHTRKKNRHRPSTSGYKMSNSGRVVPGTHVVSEEPPKKPKKTSKPKQPRVPAYQAEVYEDVMGTIMNMEKLNQPFKYGRTRVRNKGSGNKSNKRRPVEVVDGMVPPPRKPKPIVSKFAYPRESYYDSGESAYPISRVYKRSINHTRSLEQSVTEANKEKSEFRIIVTTPEPTTNLTPKYSASSPRGFIIGRYDIFGEKSQGFDQRRREPRYNLPNTSDSTDFGSTFIPVIVKPDEVTKSKLLKNSKGEDQESFGDKVSETRDSRKRYSPQSLRDEKLATLADAYTLEPPAEEHEELNDFLKGDPPGYDKAFPESEHQDKPKELLQKEESKVSKSYSQDKKDGSAEESDSKEADSSKSAEETSREAASGEENDESKEAALSSKTEKKSSDESKNDEPFERYSDRPNSPPENYEDERYSDLGPRINKPYFYHPPFEIPEYERNKNVDRSDNADLNTSEETEGHETYVYPWEKDDESKEAAYVYPWDKQEKVKEKKESSQEKYETEENSEEATNTQPIYIPLGGKHVRGKKDVTKEEMTPESDTSSKFSSKYKLDTTPSSDKETSSSNADEVKQTTEAYLKESIVSRPSAKPRTTPRSNDTDSTDLGESTSDDKLNSSSTTPSSRFSRAKLDPRFRLRYPGTTRSFSPTTQSTTPSGFVRRRGRIRGNSTDTSTTTSLNSRRRTRPIASAPSIVTATASDRRRRPFTFQPSANTPTSTVRTITHRSRVSKQQIITKTTYPDEDDEDDSAPESTTKPYPTELTKVSRGRKPSNDSQTAPKKKKKVEKVVITMEETPDHVYETKEVDRNGVKGKFVTITANNNSDTGTTRDDEDIRMQDAEIEEINRRKSADNSFNSMIRDTEDLVDKSSGVEDYMMGDLLQKSPLPASRKSNNQTEGSNDDNEDDEENDGEEEENDDDDEVDDYEDHHGNDDENNEDEGNEEEPEEDKKGEKESDSEKKKSADDDDDDDGGKNSERNSTSAYRAKVEDKSVNKTEPPKKAPEERSSSRNVATTRRRAEKPDNKPEIKSYQVRKKLPDIKSRTRDFKVSSSSGGADDSRNVRSSTTTTTPPPRRRKVPAEGSSPKTQTKRSAADDNAEVEEKTRLAELPAGVIKDPSVRKYFYVE